MTTIYSNRKIVTASDAELYELTVRNAHIVIITDPASNAWYSIGRYGKARGNELPPSEWITCPVLDISGIDDDDNVAKIIEDCTSPTIGVTDISGLIKGLVGLGAGSAYIDQGRVIVTRGLKRPDFDDHAYERDHRDPTFWRTDHTQLAAELAEHDRTCKCPECSGEPIFDDHDETWDCPHDMITATLHHDKDGWTATTKCDDCGETLHTRTTKDCPHLHVTITWRLYAEATREQPAEHIGRAQCNDCLEWMEPEDVPADAERKEITLGRR